MEGLRLDLVLLFYDLKACFSFSPMGGQNGIRFSIFIYFWFHFHLCWFADGRGGGGGVISGHGDGIRKTEVAVLQLPL